MVRSDRGDMVGLTAYSPDALTECPVGDSQLTSLGI